MYKKLIVIVINYIFDIIDFYNYILYNYLLSTADFYILKISCFPYYAYC